MTGSTKLILYFLFAIAAALWLMLGKLHYNVMPASESKRDSLTIVLLSRVIEKIDNNCNCLSCCILARKLHEIDSAKMVGLIKKTSRLDNLFYNDTTIKLLVNKVDTLIISLKKPKPFKMTMIEEINMPDKPNTAKKLIEVELNESTRIKQDSL